VDTFIVRHMPLRAKRTYKLRQLTLERVRVVREQREAELWSAARADGAFRAEVDAIARQLGDAETRPA
jgi:hypothetical protein